MIGGKKLAILAVVFAALAAFVYFYEIRGKGGADKPAETKKVVQISSDKVQKITLARRGENPIVVVKEGGKWKIVQPVPAMADPAAVDGLVQSLADMSSDRTLDKADPGKYGLRTPSVTV